MVATRPPPPPAVAAAMLASAAAASGSGGRGQKWMHHQHSLPSHHRGAPPPPPAGLPAAGLPGAARYLPPKRTRTASDLYSRFNNCRFGNGSGGIDIGPRKNNSGSGVGGGIFLDELSS